MTFALSKVFWFVFNPETLLLVLTGTGAILALTQRWRRTGRGLLILVALLAVGVAATPVADWSVRALEDRFPPPASMPASVDGVIALGGLIDPGLSRDRDQPAFADGAERVIEAVRLARRYRSAKLVFTGGSGNLLHPELAEAPIAREVLLDLGVDPVRLVIEGRSRNTRENAVLARELVDPRPGEAWLLVTSAHHMPRSVAVFKAAGWPVTAYPVDYRTRRASRYLRFSLLARLELLEIGLHEWIGLVAYRLLGWTDELFPAPADGDRPS